MPEKKKKIAPKDVFLHLLMIAALYVSVVSFLALLFQYANMIFPDALDFYYEGITERIRWAGSALMVTFPVFLFLASMVERDFRKAPEKRNFAIRKWLIYFTIFAAAITMIVDLITLIYNFWGGDLTVKFFIKTISVLGVAAAVFGYFLWDLKRSAEMRSALPRIAAWIAGLTALAGIVSGFFIVGTPAQQRDRRFDERRVNDLQMIQGEIINYWMLKRALPTKMDELRNSISGFVPPTDPKTSAPYEYRATPPFSFELCATFIAAGLSSSKFARPVPAYGPYGARQETWEHGIGRVCFTRIIDPDLYPDRPSMGKPVRPL